MGRKRVNMSMQLARALASGRSEPAPPTRASILAALLRKRSVAANAGLAALEAQIRNQILWALPIERPAENWDQPGFDAAAAADGIDPPPASPCDL